MQPGIGKRLPIVRLRKIATLIAKYLGLYHY
jgi:hypothetical protein